MEVTSIYVCSNEIEVRRRAEVTSSQADELRERKQK
jgi:hypothetical protein